MKKSDLWFSVKVVLCIIVFAGSVAALVIFVNGQNQEAFRQDVQKVERFCGPEVAEAFKASLDNIELSGEESAEYIKRCTTR